MPWVLSRAKRGGPLLNLPFPHRPTERAGLTTRHLPGTADPSQEYNLRDLSSSEDERKRQTLNLTERMPAALTSTAFNIYASLVLTLSSKSSSSHAFSRTESPLAAATSVLALASS